MNKHFAVIGGGIAGLATAVALQQKGYNVKVFESASDIRDSGGGLVLAVNAVKSLRKLGIENAIRSVRREMPVFKVLDSKGKIISDMEDDFLIKTFGINNIAISRNALLNALKSQVNDNCIETGKRAVNFHSFDNSIQIQFEDGTFYNTDYLIAAEGVHSNIRQQLLPNSKPRYAGYTCWRAVIDTPASNQKFGFEALGKEGRCGITPLADNKTYWFAVVNAPRNSEAMKKMGANELWQRFKNYPEPLPSLIKQTKDNEIIWSDIVDIKPISTFAFDNVLLVGDTAHATTPKMAQGACQAIEDAAVLLDILDKEQNIKTAFKQFEQRRVKRTHKIVKGSWTLGKISQLENPIMIALRNFLFRHIPQSTTTKQLKEIYAVDF
ncbi:MAG: FAD-dependent monooxygenase [Segetibacter sp.]